MIRKVISGGQTGVDRAGLDAAINAGIPIGGYSWSRYVFSMKNDAMVLWVIS
jgi:hypothetical protein